MGRGRPRATGRYDTREELEEAVCSFYYNSPQTISEVCRACQISIGVFNQIVKEKGPEWNRENKEKR